jgi:hypothetical protein
VVVLGVWGSEALSLAFSILFRLLDLTRHFPGERVGSGDGLLGRFVRAVGEGPRRRRTNRRGLFLDPYKRKSHKYFENDRQVYHIAGNGNLKSNENCRSILDGFFWLI